MKSKIIVMSILLLVLQGCYSQSLVMAVNSYCRISEPNERAAIRALVNADISPHTIQIECSSK